MNSASAMPVFSRVVIAAIQLMAQVSSSGIQSIQFMTQIVFARNDSYQLMNQAKNVIPNQLMIQRCVVCMPDIGLTLYVFKRPFQI